MAARQQCWYEQLPQLAVAVGATTPDPESVGVLAWSTTADVLVMWDGVRWTTPFGEPVLTATDGATITLDCSLGSRFAVTIAATGRTLALSNDRDHQRVELLVKQDATGGRTITAWPIGTRWAGGAAPTLTAGANKWDLIRLDRVSSGVYVGSVLADI